MCVCMYVMLCDVTWCSVCVCVCVRVCACKWIQVRTDVKVSIRMTVTIHRFSDVLDKFLTELMPSVHLAQVLSAVASKRLSELFRLLKFCARLQAMLGADEFIPGAFNGHPGEDDNVNLQMVAAGSMAAQVLIEVGQQIFRAVWNKRQYEPTGSMTIRCFPNMHFVMST